MENVDCHVVCEKKLKYYCPCMGVLRGTAASALSSHVEDLPICQFLAPLTVPGFLYVGRCQYAHVHILIN